MRNRTVSLTFFSRVATAALSLALGTATAAGAQTSEPQPPPAAPSFAAPAPSYATPVSGEHISGVIAAVTGKYTLQVRDSRGFLDNVELHQGTIINPRGLTLAAGMQVTISGSNAGAAFSANQIDAPYTIAVVPGYAYGPAYGLGFGFGGPGWGWGSRFRSSFWW
jgi:opacity protein-like surface antigen